MHARLITLALGLLVGIGSQFALRAGETNSTHRLFKCDVALVFSSGAIELHDKIEDSLIANGFDVDDSYVVPVGLTFSPYLDFECGFGLGLTVGPTEFVSVDRVSAGGSSTDINYTVPVGAFVQYELLRDGNVSPYVRVGFKYPFYGGDYIQAGSGGPYGVVGVNIWAQRRIGFGVEAGYDASEVKVNAGPGSPAQKVKPVGFTIGVFARF